MILTYLHQNNFPSDVTKTEIMLETFCHLINIAWILPIMPSTPLGVYSCEFFYFSTALQKKQPSWSFVMWT